MKARTFNFILIVLFFAMPLVNVLSANAVPPPNLYVEYDLGMTAPASARKVEFLVQLGSDPLDLTYIMDVPVAEVGVEVSQSFDTGDLTAIPTGVGLLYYIRVTDVDGDVLTSPGYLFKVPGKPAITFMRRAK